MIYKVLSKEEKKASRKWARENYVTDTEICGVWHPVVQEECVAMNREKATFVRPTPTSRAFIKE
jgi:hypothetical protein